VLLVLGDDERESGFAAKPKNLSAVFLGGLGGLRACWERREDLFLE